MDILKCDKLTTKMQGSTRMVTKSLKSQKVWQRLAKPLSCPTLQECKKPIALCGYLALTRVQPWELEKNVLVINNILLWKSRLAVALIVLTPLCSEIPDENLWRCVGQTSRDRFLNRQNKYESQFLTKRHRTKVIGTSAIENFVQRTGL